jgi:hypothetical protein
VFGHFQALTARPPRNASDKRKSRIYRRKLSRWRSMTKPGTQAANKETSVRYAGSVTKTTRRDAMFAIQMSRNVFQSAACLVLSIMIVTTSLTIAALGTDYSVPNPNYSVTVTQLS